MGLLGRMARRVLKRVAGVPEIDVFADIQRLLDGRRVETILDVGGCFGEVALRFESMFPEAHVYSFEPSPATLPTLRANIEGHDRIVPVPKGCYHTNTTRTLHINRWPGATSLLDRPRSGLPYHNPVAVHVDEVEVELVRLDDWAAAEGVERVDMIKIDVQGAELDALRGAERLLADVQIVYPEVQFHPNYEGACLLDELWSFLRGHGFSLYQLYEVWGSTNGQVVQGDALFVSEALRRDKLSRDEPFRSVRYLN